MVVVLLRVVSYDPEKLREGSTVRGFRHRSLLLALAFASGIPSGPASSPTRGVYPLVPESIRSRTLAVRRARADNAFGGGIGHPRAGVTLGLLRVQLGWLHKVEGG